MRQHDDTAQEEAAMRKEFAEIPPERYKLVQHIGKGAFSRVFLAYTPEFQRRAVKRIRLTAKPHMLLKEIEFLRRLEGKEGIVQIKEIRFSEQTLQTTVITNYLDSDDFKSIILDFTPRQIQQYMKSLLTALSHLEKVVDPQCSDLRGILHRDVKPGNFLFERKTGKGLLIDFGLAQSIREAREFPLMRQNKRQSGTGAGQKSIFQRAYEISGYIDKDLQNAKPLPVQPHSGTHGYRAPEILVPVRNQDPKIDSWSAGVILLQIITGKTSIFRGNPNTDVYELMAIRSIIGTDRFIQSMSRLRADFSFTAGVSMPQAISLEELCEWYNPDLLAVLPAACFDLCRSLLEFDPGRRLCSSQALIHPFITTPTEQLVDYRFQDGAANRSLIAFAREGQSKGDEVLAAMRKRSSDLSEILGLCRATSETLADEYGRLSAATLMPLPKEIRKQIERAVQKYGTDRSVESPSGVFIERYRQQDYIFPMNAALQDLNQTQNPTLAKSKLAAAPGYQARPSYCEQAVQQRTEQAIRQLKHQATYQKADASERLKQERDLAAQIKRQTYDELWEEANCEKEEFERMVRATALRRRVDCWIQPLKALDKELRLAQRQVRQAAEDYRRVVLEMKLVDMEPKSTDAADVSANMPVDPVPQQQVHESQEHGKQIDNATDLITTDVSSYRSELLRYICKNSQNLISELSAQAWASIQNVDNTENQQLQDQINVFNIKATRIASVSHRIALRGSAGWFDVGKQVKNPVIEQRQENARILNLKAFNLSQKINKFDSQVQEYEDQIEQEIDFIRQCDIDIQRYQQEINSWQQQSEYYSVEAVSKEIQISSDNMELTKNQLAQHQTRYQNLKDSLEVQKNLLMQERNERDELLREFKAIQLDQLTIEQQNQEQWSETITVSDEFSEVKPNPKILAELQRDYNPAELQEPYFTNPDELQKLFEQKDAIARQRKNRRVQIRKYEQYIENYYNFNLIELEKLQRDIFQARLKVFEKIKPKSQIDLQSIVAEIASAGLEAARAQQVSGQKFTNNNEQTTSQFFNDIKAYILQNVTNEEAGQSLLQVFTSPLLRYYTLHEEAEYLETLGSSTQLKTYNQLKNQLDDLMDTYRQLPLYRQDLIITAAAVQNELDAVHKDSQQLGLSRRAPNIDYLLNLNNQVNQLLKPSDQVEQRSKSAIYGVGNSAAQRDLVHPGKVQEMYPKTSQYLSQMMKSVVKKLTMMPNIITLMEQQVQHSIDAIHGRVFQAVVEDAIRTATTYDLEMLQNLKQMIQSLGAVTVLQIARGSVTGAKIYQKRKVVQKRDKQLWMFDDDYDKLKKGEINESLVNKLNFAADNRRLIANLGKDRRKKFLHDEED